VRRWPNSPNASVLSIRFSAKWAVAFGVGRDPRPTVSAAPPANSQALPSASAKTGDIATIQASPESGLPGIGCDAVVLPSQGAKLLPRPLRLQGLPWRAQGRLAASCRDGR
jgi:hypothetical protein